MGAIVRISSVSAAAIAALALSGAAQAQQAPDFSAVEITTTQLADGLYLLVGQGGNIVASVGEDGVFLVDDQYAELYDKITAALGALTDQPVKFVVNTHHHGDHNSGNTAFGAAGATIIATEETHDRIRAGFEAPAQGEARPAPDHALPTLIYEDELTLHFNGETIHIFHPGAGHTDGDTWVYFENAGVLHAGDAFRTTSYQGADVAGGGDIDGIVEVYRELLAEYPADTRLIPGHGVEAPLSALAEHVEMIEAIQGPVEAAKAEGKSLEEVIALNLTADYDERWSSGRYNGEYIVTTLYNAAD